jgi:hypothetical protein
MKPGEYTGKDGITYRWEKTSEGYTVVDCCSACWSIAPADWPAAKAALDGLVEEAAEAEHVEKLERTEKESAIAKTLASKALHAIETYCDCECVDESLCDECSLNIQDALDECGAALAELEGEE